MLVRLVWSTLQNLFQNISQDTIGHWSSSFLFKLTMKMHENSPIYNLNRKLDDQCPIPDYAILTPADAGWCTRAVFWHTPAAIGRHRRRPPTWTVACRASTRTRDRLGALETIGGISLIEDPCWRLLTPVPCRLMATCLAVGHNLWHIEIAYLHQLEYYPKFSLFFHFSFKKRENHNEPYQQTTN